MEFDYIVDTSRDKLSTKNTGGEQEFLVYYELHVSDKTFYVHGLIHAKDSVDAMDKMPETIHGDGYTLQKKGTYGAIKDENRMNIHKKLHAIGGGIILP